MTGGPFAATPAVTAAVVLVGVLGAGVVATDAESAGPTREPGVETTPTATSTADEAPTTATSASTATARAPPTAATTTPTTPTAATTPTTANSMEQSAGGPASGAPDAEPYTFQVPEVEDCGATCRDVTVRLTNRRPEQATDVVVHVRIFAGNTTDGDAQVWEDTERVGSLRAGGNVTVTKRVELTYAESVRVEREGGWITILTTVTSDGEPITITERRDVS